MTIIFWGINVLSLVCVCERFGETVAVCIYADDGIADLLISFALQPIVSVGWRVCFQRGIGLTVRSDWKRMRTSRRA